MPKKNKVPLPEILAKQSVDEVDFLPDVTELNIDSVIESYIEHHVNEDSRDEMLNLAQTIEALEQIHPCRGANGLDVCRSQAA